MSVRKVAPESSRKLQKTPVNADSRPVTRRSALPMGRDAIDGDLGDRSEDAVAGAVHRQAIDSDRQDLVRFRDLDHEVGGRLPRQLYSVMTAVPEVCASIFVYSSDPD